ncbi:hypothetical protein [Acaryochloris marina]|uniref:Uncharacterized protein n=1 Tax=Acaryochloris marina (strain MBIC 11017) TaxID=329726 RepID=A8ZKW5_ACAM1|nr:hypothetical protein [Acaryochloris marina]ABW31433.1 hypothetical protein AM1_A0315 [Acaryochloris marina MBIC11017]
MQHPKAKAERGAKVLFWEGDLADLDCAILLLVSGAATLAIPLANSRPNTSPWNVPRGERFHDQYL